ncbi:MAG: Gfo/Idh/MocA family oxidoreductase [Clostridiales Family XIII bacterium]|jgi:predicted dehydrogenase|nr:Gfo/Idh/MocA family oxidoreductase [Clostridiales Family XIII bacterium]
MSKLNVAVIGMNFGKEFVKLYLNHPDVDRVAICQRTEDALREAGDELGIPEEARFTDFDDVLAQDWVDAVHIITPPATHADYTIKALNAGKHAASTVPMGLSVRELQDICELREQTGLVYMMMETAVYTREFLYVRNLASSGKLGKIQFVRGSHMQDMGLEGWPEYWLGFPPFWYGTHAISPLIIISGKMAEYVIGHGSGTLSDDLARRYGSPYPVETVTIRLKDSDVAAEATRSLYETVRQYRESFDVYGTKMAYEWEQIAEEGAALFEGGESARRVFAPDTDELLIEELKPFTKREVILNKDNVSFIQGAGHGGSHPHLVQEFVASIVEGRAPLLDAATSANITAAGILGHESALKGGERIYLPEFR